jgi:SAM-dependent methyltransferase
MNGFEQQWQRRFEKFATRHQSEHEVSGWSLTGLRHRVATFERLLDRGLLPARARVLELGCGAGTYVRLLGKHGHRAVGLDYSLPTLARAVAADPSPRGRYAAGSAYALPFHAGAFQAVVCVGVLQAIEQPSLALSEIARILAPKGTMVVETLNPWNPLAVRRRLTAFLTGQPTRFRYGTPARIERWMRALSIRPAQRVSILLPPRSLPGLERVLARSWVERLLSWAPGLRAITAQAFWLVGVKS